MKSSRLLLLAGFISGIYSAAQAQVLILTGSITGTSGIYFSDFSPGESVKLTLDFTPAYIYGEVFKGVYPGISYYYAFVTLTLAGNDFPLISQPTSLLPSFKNGMGPEGLFLGEGWRSSDGIDHGIVQSMLSPDDILSAGNQFPSDIPISTFTNTAGHFESHSYSTGTGIIPLGQIDWEITNYTGSVPAINDPPPPFHGTPEPATYGIFASLGLVALAARRARSMPKVSKVCLPQ